MHPDPNVEILRLRVEEHTEASLARAAALFDALGTWLLQPGAANGLRIAAHPRLLAELQEHWGGSLGGRTKIDGRVSETWWTLTGEEAERFVAAIELDLTLKAEQARVFLRMRSLVARPGEKLSEEVFAERRALYDQLMRLREVERTARWEPLPGMHKEAQQRESDPPCRSWLETPRVERSEPRSGFDLLREMRRPAP